jgi:hypothetical protein
MGRRIVTSQLQASGGSGRMDTYFDKVIKYIPADIVAAWVAVTGIINGASTRVSKGMLLWLAFIVGIALTALWTWRQTEKPGQPIAKTQIAVSTGAFGVWVFALGGPFAALSWYDPVFGSLLLILYTLVVGIINPAE